MARGRTGVGLPGTRGRAIRRLSVGLAGYSGRAGQNWSNGLSLYGPPVPVYGPIPGLVGNDDLVHQWRRAGLDRLPFGWVGVYAASPRPRPLTVGVRSDGRERADRARTARRRGPAGRPRVRRPPVRLSLSVKVPQPAAEVFVDGVKTAQTGTDRIFESPPLEAGKQYKYEVTARWVEGGATREVKKAVVGTPGEVVRVDFTTGN